MANLVNILYILCQNILQWSIHITTQLYDIKGIEYMA